MPTRPSAQSPARLQKIARHPSYQGRLIEEEPQTPRVLLPNTTSITLTGRRFIHEAEQILTSSGINSVRLIAVAFLIDQVAQVPALRLVRSLNLEGNHIGDAGLVLLLQSPFLNGLNELNLRNNSLTITGIKQLQEWNHWPNLMQCDWTGNLDKSSV